MSSLGNANKLGGSHVRIKGFGFHFPGDPVAIADLPLTEEERKRLPGLGQVVTHISEENSTELMVHATRDAMNLAGVGPAKIRMIISAPSLMTSFGLEIPSVAVRARLGLVKAQCLNLAQGCVGVLRGIDLATSLLQAQPDDGDIIVVTSCRASQHTRNMSHGAFFWGDAGGAVVLTAEPGPGLEIAGYCEASNDDDWGAMRIDCGDETVPGEHKHSGLINVQFGSAESQVTYIRGEQQRFAAVVDGLLKPLALRQEDIEAVFVPSTGKRRVPVLFSEHRELLQRLKTDFQFAHFGGVDAISSIHRYHEQRKPGPGGWLLAASPAFAAQWGGILLRVPGT